MNFKPINDRVIITLVEKPQKGDIIIISDNSTPTGYARVEAIGDLVTKVAVEDIVIIYKCDATPIEIDNITYGHLKESQIVGIYNKE